jgi:hypothetical protein
MVAFCLMVVATSEQAYARRHHHHTRYHSYHGRYSGEQAIKDFGFCQSIRDAFSTLGVADLGRFVATIPSSRKAEASRCLN